jgi:NDP-sugar pyrophosphorylase family protein
MDWPNKMQLIVPMSGMGQRFLDAGYKIPKPLISVSNKTILQHVVEMFPGIDEVLFIINEQHALDETLALQETLYAIAPHAEIAVIPSHKQGPAWAIRQAATHINLEAPVIVNYCDFSCIWNFQDFRKSLESGIDGLIATYSGFHPHMLRNSNYAVLQMDESGRVSGIQEKLSYTDSPMTEPASSGTYGFGSGRILLEAIDLQISADHSYNKEFYTSLTYRNMIERGLQIQNFPIEKFLQWGTPDDLQDFMSQKEYFLFRSKYEKSQTSFKRIAMLAAGAGTRFIDSGYKTIKPFLPLGEHYLVIEAMKALGDLVPSKRVLFQKTFKIPEGVLQICHTNGIEIELVDGITSGQAESALKMLENSQSRNCVIATCDSLLFPHADNYDEVFNGKTLGVWVTQPSNHAIRFPSQFGWVLLNESDEIEQVSIKEAPPILQGWHVITGTFIFGDTEESCNLIREFLSTNERINKEFYLDALIEFAQIRNWKIKGLHPKWFISLGTPNEYETYRYWESFFKDNPNYLVEN